MYKKNIIQKMIELNKFKLLLQLIKKSDLEKTLSSKGGFTLFAPNDGAFKKISKREFQSIINDRKKIIKVLTYHLLDHEINSDEIKDMESAETIEGSRINIDTNNFISINNSKIIITDIECNNGIIHVIDKILIPNGGE